MSGRPASVRRGWRRLLATLPVLSVAAAATAAGPLPALNLDLRETSLSGLSSGGFMAVQMLVAHSSIVKGAGIIAAGPYYCAQNSALKATTQCSCTLDPGHRYCSVTATSTNVPALLATMRRFAAEGSIDDTGNIARQRAYLVAGGRDRTVPAAVVEQLADFLRGAGMPAGHLAVTTLADSGHGLPTPNHGNACATTDAPYINDCDFDAVGELLAWIHGPLAPARTGAPRGRFVAFDQRPYIPPGLGWFSPSGLDNGGWLYLPDQCARGDKCRLHVALHGCRQGQSYSASWWPGGERYGREFVDHAGYDRWADSNGFVILYPQAESVAWSNPNGCWDWWGYTDGHYADRKGVQIRTLRAMVDRLGAGAAP